MDFEFKEALSIQIDFVLCLKLSCLNRQFVGNGAEIYIKSLLFVNKQS